MLPRFGVRHLLQQIFWIDFLCAFASKLNVISSHEPGTVFSFNDQPTISYLTASQAVLDVKRIVPSLSAKTLSQFNPVTNVIIKHRHLTKNVIQEHLHLYAKTDDVWNKRFLETLIISYDGDSSTGIDLEAYKWLKAQGVSRIFLSGPVQPPSNEPIPTYLISGILPPGPFIFSAKGGTSRLKIHNVYRLYLDEFEGFLFGSIPDAVNGGWVLTNITNGIPATENGPETQMIPAPSRLAMLGSNLPLAGTRFGLKDIYDAQGLPTAAGSHAYQRTHPVPNTTAPSITKLLDLGSVMVGKTRTSQFAHGAQPWEFVDVPYSWNPRGDGHLTASASSSGSACAIAAYEWLDYTVGSDTRGSVRKPAALVGVYDIRPSHGSMDLTGVVTLSEEMDTAGFFARHPILFHEAAKRWYSDSPVASTTSATRFPSTLYYPTEHFPVKNQEAQKLINHFLSSLQELFGIQTVHVNFTNILSPYLLNGNFPAFQLSSNKLAEYRSWKDVGEPTTKAFISQFGQEPVFDPVPQKMFARARAISDRDFAEAVALKRQFRDSVAANVFKHHPDSCSDSLFIYDAATGGLPSYRVEDFNHLSGATHFLLTAAGAGVEAKMSDFFNFLASMGELPEVTIPIGQVHYFSQLSRTWEPIPVAVQLVSRKGCDAMLLDLVKALADKDVVRAVQTGRSLV
ncbi:hypothetical protein D9613_004861 [Agrocybe pediades]|uniref:Amidase domain-containing protein n=1 Tax=Agrocybe pediades TaxID=84607 RepID=A0A8H4QYU6_9AGAR|nr:hypothetical protein D9613_004861 [Agrocybe pediades]